jgi:glutamate-1-semialdehyde 2,1-aminomutase
MNSNTVARDNCPRCRGGPETFYYLGGQYLYDVDRARELVQDGRETVEVDEDTLRESIEESELDECHLDHVDPQVPGIIAHIFYDQAGETIQGHVLIDGHHRGARCLRDGLPFLAYLLDETESRAVLIRSQGKHLIRETDDETAPAAAAMLAEYEGRFSASAQISARARSVIAGATTHDRRGFGPFSVYIDRAQGVWKWTVENAPLIDFWMGHGSLLLGHNYPPVVEAVQRQMERGTHYGGCHELEVRWAELIRDIIPSAERVRFTASGTEATQLAFRVARAYTNRPKILKLDGHFHGWHDEAMAHDYNAANAGFNPGTLENVISASSNEPEKVFAILEEEDIAGIILEPGGGGSGGLPWDAGYLRELRDRTRQEGVLLIFDEVISGFRQTPGGVQGLTGITPDLTTLAKIVSGGLPGGALVGADRYMAVFGPGTPRQARWAQVPHTGTFNANPLSATAGIALLEAIRDGAAQERARRAAEMLVQAVNASADIQGVDVFLYTNGTSVFHILIGARKNGLALGPSHAITALYRARDDLYALLRRALLLEGIDCHLMHGWVSALHDDADVQEKAAAAFDRAFGRLQALPGFRRAAS